MTPTKRSTHSFLLPSLLLLLFLALPTVTPPVALGAVARASVTAEVVNPAVIDAAKILSAASGQASQPDQKSDSQVQPQVQLTVVDGIPFLTIDYN